MTSFSSRWSAASSTARSKRCERSAPQALLWMKIVSVITDPNTVDKILAHRNSGGGHDPFEPRGPPHDLLDTG
jgi:hypothetical protein